MNGSESKKLEEPVYPKFDLECHGLCIQPLKKELECKLTT